MLNWMLEPKETLDKLENKWQKREEDLVVLQQRSCRGSFMHLFVLRRHYQQVQMLDRCLGRSVTVKISH